MNLICTRCKKRMAVVFMTRIEGDETVNDGLCLKCARELGIPQVEDMIEKMGISGEELEAMSAEMFDPDHTDGPENGDFKPGFFKTYPFLQKMFGQQPGQLGQFGQPGQGSQAIPGVPGEQQKKGPKGKEQPEKPKYKFLDSYCENLTQKARDGGIDRIIGRDSEIDRILQILNRRTKNNPCLIGEPGVGKTAIAEGIAQRIALGNVPMKLAQKEIYLLDLTALVAGTQFRGQFESRVKGLVDDVKKAGNVILFIDEVHNMVGVGDSEGSMNAANILKPSLSRGVIQVIGATTFNEYRKHIEKDAALERRFQPVTINEPSIDDTVEVLKGIKEYYEKYHYLKISDSLLRHCAVLAERYITDRFLPDKAIDLLDEACSCAGLGNNELMEYQSKSAELAALREKENALESDAAEIDYEELAKVKAGILRTEARVNELKPAADRAEVTLDDLAKVIELWTGIPSSKVRESELKKVSGLEAALKAKIIGQDEAVEAVAAAIKRTRIQIGAKNLPASFIFAGPTGVGKTELVKVLANELFSTVDPLIRLDMSEFMEKHAVSRIVGSPPGYIGYDEAGQLTEKVRRKPYSVVLFDEIEKAHPDVMNILLQILDEGKITDAHGRAVSFANTAIVMTTNAGSESRETGLGFGKSSQTVQKEKVEKALAAFLRPEFLGRVDEVVIFRQLDIGDFARIAVLMLNELKASLDEKGIKFGYDDNVPELIAQKSFNLKSGARDIRKVIRKEIEDKICSVLVDNADNMPGVVQITAEEGAFAVHSL